MKPALQLVDMAFVRQAEYILDESHLQASLCTRRAGKSYGIGLKMARIAKLKPGCTVLYIALTRDSAKNIMWKDVIKDINRKYSLGMKFNETELSATLPNGPDPANPYDGGSLIRLVGMDAGKDEMEKVLGGKYAAVFIDEAQAYRIDLRKLVYEQLEPAVADWGGFISLSGTPGPLTFGLFYDVTKTDATGDENAIEPGWAVHRWNTLDNPYMVEAWKLQEARILERDPSAPTQPWYRRMHLGEWVKDDSDLCYKYNETINYVKELPGDTSTVWTNVLAVDLGFNDDSAFFVWSWRDYDPNLYGRDAYKRSGMDVTDVAERIKYFEKLYNPIAIVVDNASKQAVEELKNRHDLPLEAAEKTGKAEFIEIMNAEYTRGILKLTPKAAAVVGPEYAKLIWDPEEKKKRKFVEHPACPNHAADAGLYGFRKALHYRVDQEPKKKTTTEKLDEWEEQEAEKVDQAKRNPFGFGGYDDGSGLLDVG